MDSCQSLDTFSGPQTVRVTHSASSTDKPRTLHAALQIYKYDSVNPVVSATPSRAANANGWYNSPFTVAYSGTDTRRSGIDTCQTPDSVSGPQTESWWVSGSCTDHAGNTTSDSDSYKFVSL